jgi:hypothetical protein
VKRQNHCYIEKRACAKRTWSCSYTNPHWQTVLDGFLQGSKNMARGKCPSCEQLLAELIVDAHITGRVHAGKKLRCINFLCPNCNTVVGSQMDPVPVKTETVDLLMQKLRFAN